jgi:hypothetical protein
MWHWPRVLACRHRRYGASQCSIKVIEDEGKVMLCSCVLDGGIKPRTVRGRFSSTTIISLSTTCSLLLSSSLNNATLAQKPIASSSSLEHLLLNICLSPAYLCPVYIINKNSPSKPKNMLFNAFFTTLLLATASSSVSAAPMNAPQELIVFNPPITSPKEFAAWAKGSEQIVRWGASFASTLALVYEV